MGVAGNDVAEKKIQQIDTISILDKLELERQEKERQALELKVPRVYLSMAILFCINLLNYMDRYTIAGVLTNIQGYYGINDAQGGLLQTIFMVFFMICSPICGFLGDRYVRKWIMIAGIAVWVLAVLASTFVPANLFWLFLLFRGIVGIGEASYAVISPSIIGDMFTGENRSRMLMFFYFAIPCGSGLGFMVGSSVAALTNDWRWGIRITAVLGVFCLLAIIIFIREPERGGAERERGEIATEVVATSYTDDLKSLVSNYTYVFSTAGYTAIVFVVGTLTWWAPTAIEHSDAYKHGLNNTDELNPDSKAQVNLIFGAITCVGGIAGVGIGSMLASFMRSGCGPFRYVKTVRADAVVCGLGALIGVPTLFVSIHEIQYSMVVCWVFMFICITATCFNWAINVDMLMAVVVPSRRNAANSWQILLSHLFGDASGPYILGLISDAIRGDDDTPEGHFRSLQISFFLPNVLLILSAVLFFISAYTFVRDQKKFQQEMGVIPKYSTQSYMRSSSSSSPAAQAHENEAYSPEETSKM